MGKLVQFRTKDSDTLEDRWSKIIDNLDRQTGLALKISSDHTMELHISENIDIDTLIGLLEIFKSQLSSI